MRRSIPSRAGLAAAAALLCLVATGCNDSSPKASDPTTPAASESDDTTSESPTAEDTPSEDTEPTIAAGKDVDPADFVDLVLQALAQGESARIGMNQSVSGLEATGEVSYQDPIAMTMEMKLPALGADAIQVRLVDNVMYMQLPTLGGKFIAFDLDDPTNPLGSTFTDLLDPTKQAELISSSVKKVKFLGTEDLRGESMDHYEVLQDPQAVLDQMDLPNNVPAPTLPKVITLDYWFDQDGFVRQAVTDMGKSLGKSTQTFDDWGLDVTVEKPADADIMQVPTGAQG